MKYVLPLLLSSGLVFGAFAQDQAQSLPESELVIVTDDAETTITVELADDPDELATGLMYRDGIAADRGMLFDFGDPREANMYMRNVSFGLDMLFLDEDGEVLAIAQHVQPYSERLINPGIPVKGVLELAAGQVKAFAIEPGDMVQHPMFASNVNEDIVDLDVVEAEPDTSDIDMTDE